MTPYLKNRRPHLFENNEVSIFGRTDVVILSRKSDH